MITVQMQMSSTSAAEKIAEELRTLCGAGVPGDPLPSVRALMRARGVSPVTVNQAISTLVEEGLLVAMPGRGTFIAPRRQRRPSGDHAWQSLCLGVPPSASMNELMVSPPPGCLHFANGYLDASLLPDKELARASGRALRKASPWRRAPECGLPELREWFARRASAELSEEDVTIVHGGQAAIGISIRAVVGKGETLLVESPTYLGALAVARAAGIQLVPVPTDGGGIRTDLLEEAFHSTKARALYLQPLYANPTGVNLAQERRQEVLNLARKHGAFIIEDDYARDLSHQGRPAPTLISQDDGHVIYIRSLTKSIAPSLRLAALCARGPVVTRLRTARLVDDFFVPLPLQDTAMEFVSHGSYPSHLRRVQGALSLRTQVAVDELSRALPQVSLETPSGGYSLWLNLPQGTDTRLLCARAMERGVFVNAGAAWFAGEELGRHLRLSVAGIDQEAILVAVARLKAAFDEL